MRDTGLAILAPPFMCGGLEGDTDVDLSNLLLILLCSASDFKEAKEVKEPFC